MKYLLKSPKFLTLIFFFLLLLPSCNNEEVFVIEESQLIAEEPEEGNNTEDEITPIEALDDEFITSENVSVDLEVYINDSNLPSSITVSNTNPSNGTLAIDDNGTPNNLADDSIIYTPNINFSGVDSFEYTICEATNSENCDTALVTITVEANPENIATELKAFPTAEGAGAYATGGRGGIVRHVTSLADDGSVGTLRWAINTSNNDVPVTVVFDVSGTINTGNASLNVNINNCTIAGQTAPRGGITIQGKWFGFYQAENLIMRYIRIVNTDYFSSNPGASITNNGSGANNCILDHVSMRYAWISPGFVFQDNNDTRNGQGDITLQRSIIADNHTGGIVGAIVDEPRTDLAGKNSVHHNLFAHVDHRFPNVAGNGQAEIVENVIYNYRNRLSTFFNDSESNLINNTYKAGSASKLTLGGYNKIGEYIPGTPRVYSKGNRRIDPYGNLEPTNDNWNELFVIWAGGYPNESNPMTPEKEALYREYNEFPALGVPITKLGTDEAYNSVLSDVGANKYLNEDGTYGVYYDDNDAQYIVDPINETCYLCQPNGDLANKGDISQLIYPVLPTNTRPADYDSDQDGMADAWENRIFGDLSRDGNGDFDEDGYTDLEEFLNVVDF